MTGCIQVNNRAGHVEVYTDNAMADVNLISAAPVLLEALELALYTIKALDEDYDEKESYINGMKAIQQAKGGL